MVRWMAANLAYSTAERTDSPMVCKMVAYSAAETVEQLAAYSVRQSGSLLVLPMVLETADDLAVWRVEAMVFPTAVNLVEQMAGLRACHLAV